MNSLQDKELQSTEAEQTQAEEIVIENIEAEVAEAEQTQAEEIVIENIEAEDTSDVALVKKDRMRFSKNKLPANLTILAIVFNCLYFISIYKSNYTYYYVPMIGVSVVCNLIFLLAAFLSAEGIKNYKFKFGIVLLVLGAFQILRIFYYPLQATETFLTDGVTPVMDSAQFTRVLIYLISSAALLIAAGVIGMMRSKILEKYRQEIGEELPA